MSRFLLEYGQSHNDRPPPLPPTTSSKPSDESAGLRPISMQPITPSLPLTVPAFISGRPPCAMSARDDCKRGRSNQMSTTSSLSSFSAKSPISNESYTFGKRRQISSDGMRCRESYPMPTRKVGTVHLRGRSTKTSHDQAHLQEMFGGETQARGSPRRVAQAIEKQRFK